MCSGNTQKYPNPVFNSPDTILDVTEEKNGPVKPSNADDETAPDGSEDEKESLKEETVV